MPPTSTFGTKIDAADDELLSSASSQLAEYFHGEHTSFQLSTATHGDPFQEQVWALLDKIPFRTTTTYGELAERLGDKSLAQQVGKAVGQNPLCIIVPCHRIVGKNGKLTGYAGGSSRPGPPNHRALRIVVLARNHQFGPSDHGWLRAIVGCLLVYIVLVVSAFIGLNVMGYGTPGVLLGLIGGGLIALIGASTLALFLGTRPFRGHYSHT